MARHAVHVNFFFELRIQQIQMEYRGFEHQPDGQSGMESDDIQIG